MHKDWHAVAGRCGSWQTSSAPHNLQNTTSVDVLVLLCVCTAVGKPLWGVWQVNLENSLSTASVDEVSSPTALQQRAVLCVCQCGCGGQWRSQELSQTYLDAPFLAYFILQPDVCFTGMYSGSSANHNGPSPGILPHDIPSRHHPLDSALSSPHHHQSSLESAREGYVLWNMLGFCLTN